MKLNQDEDTGLTIEESAAAEDTGGTMPQGFKQVDSDMTPEQIRAVRRNMYFFHGVVGIVLLPLALILRTGRWSMRTLICHHNGDEFGGF
jgi:hypothetical protein